VGKYPKAFRKIAVERLKGCESIVALSEELGVHRRLLYKWRDQLEAMDHGEGPAENGKERELRLQVTRLKRLVAEKTLEADFSKVPCKKSRLDVRATSNLARRHLRPNPGIDAAARQTEYRADVSVGRSQPSRLVPVTANEGLPRRGNGSAVGDPADLR
jgi:transposase-like protein